MIAANFKAKDFLPSLLDFDFWVAKKTRFFALI